MEASQRLLIDCFESIAEGQLFYSDDCFRCKGVFVQIDARARSKINV